MDREHKKDQLRKLRSMDEKGLQDLYNETNLIISKVRGHANANHPIKDHDMRAYERAKILRARVLTVLNQRFHKKAGQVGYGRKNGDAQTKMSGLRKLVRLEPRRNLQGR